MNNILNKTVIHNHNQQFDHLKMLSQIINFLDFHPDVVRSSDVSGIPVFPLVWTLLLILLCKQAKRPCKKWIVQLLMHEGKIIVLKLKKTKFFIINCLKLWRRGFTIQIFCLLSLLLLLSSLFLLSLPTAGKPPLPCPLPPHPWANGVVAEEEGEEDGEERPEGMRPRRVSQLSNPNKAKPLPPYSSFFIFSHTNRYVSSCMCVGMWMCACA